MDRLLLKKKLENREYISKYLYDNVKEEHPEFISNNSDLDGYNNQILEREYQKYKNYFDEMYKGIDENIHLDKEQIKAILADEDYSLILAGAGTGKTTTMASKVKYLVDIKKVNPKHIMVMSYSKKAVEELEQRINYDLKISAQVKTFHSLGMQYIREYFRDYKCDIVDDNKQKEIFLNYFKERIFPYKSKIKEIYDNFSHDLTPFSNDFINNYMEYENFDDYFANYKRQKIEEADNNLEEILRSKIERLINGEVPITIKGEIVKSKAEAEIANFLFCHGIDYKYEKVYKELVDDRHVYKPDFTLELNGEKVHIEYFGLSNYKYDRMKKYDKNKLKKEQQWDKKEHFIALDASCDGNIMEKLDMELIKKGFCYHKKTNEEIYNQLLDNNPTSQIFKYQRLLYDVIAAIKSSSDRENYEIVINEHLNQFTGNERKEKEVQTKHIIDFYRYYQEHLRGAEIYYFDFSDMLYYANKCIYNIDTDNQLNFEYLIIDEYQDISQERYELIKKIAKKNHAKVVAVGDDWQSIYGYAGSKIEYIYNFSTYFKGAQVFRIHQTYRNSQELINYSGDFVMKNSQQIKKQLVSNKYIHNPIEFVYFDEPDEYKELKKLILKIHQKNKNHRILILARNNAMIDRCFYEPELKDEVGTKISFIGYDDLDMDGMTIHKSKGLTSDEVIIIGLNKKFPSSKHKTFWLKSIFLKENQTEPIDNAEERRLFYVALTRTKNKVYLLVNKNPDHQSDFVRELLNIIEKDDYHKKVPA